MRYDVSGSGTEDLSPVHEQKLRIFPHLKLFQALCGQHCGHVPVSYTHLEDSTDRTELAKALDRTMAILDWEDVYKRQIKTYERRKAISIIPYEDGYLYDFGTDTAGVCELRIKGKPDVYKRQVCIRC